MSFPIPKVKLSDGNEIPMIGLGTWNSPVGQVYNAVKDAIDSGYRMIDCALAYQNENEVGQAIKDLITEGKVKREDLFVVGKCWNTYHKKDRVIESCKKSLKDLGLDYLDLFLMHWPMGYQEGDVAFPRDENGQMLTSDIDFIETWEGMEDCHRQGLVRSLGLSNFNSQQITRILSVASVNPVMNQVECHPYLNQSQLLDFCMNLNIRLTAYSPLGSPNRPWAKPDDPSLMEEPKILEIAKKHKKTAAQVLLRFQIQRGIIVIPKSVTKERIQSNIQIFDFELTNEDMDTLKEFNRQHRFCHLNWLKDHPYYPFGIPF